VDELYFESGYLEASYFVYVANATAGFTPYIAEGYLPADFFEDRGSFAAIFCDAEIVVGMLLEAQASLFGTFSINAGAQRFLTTSIALTSSFTQTAIGTRGKDTDLFAFSDAAISVQVSRIRGTNITASSVFSVAIDFVVERSADADVDAIFSAIINGLRSRDTITQTQAAFSFDVSANVIKGVDSTVSAQSSLSGSTEVIRAGGATLSSEITSNTSGDRVRFGLVAASAEFTVSVSARQIRDAHLTGTGVAEIVCDAVKTTSAQIALTSVFSQQTAGGFTFEYSATLTSHASVFTSRYLGGDRPKTITGTFDGSALINSATRITDLSNLPNFDNWYYQTQIQLTASSSFGAYTDKELLYIPLGTRSGAERYIRIYSVRSSESGIPIVVQGIFAPPQNASGTRNYSIFASQTSVTVGISFTGGQRLALYLPDGGGNMTRAAQIDVETAGWIISGLQTIRFANDWPFTVSSSVHTARTDYAWLTLGNYTDSGSTTYTLPTPTNTVDTLFLYQFNGNGVEELGLAQTGAATLQSQATVTSILGGTFNFAGSFNSQFTVSATVGTLEDINLVALEDAELSVDADVIRDAVSNINSETAISADVARSRDVTSTQTSETSVSVDAYRIKQFSSDLTTSAATLTVANEFQSIGANLSSRFYTAHIFFDDEYLESGYYEQFETNAVKTARGNASLQVTATLSASIRTDVLAALITTSQASVTATVVKTVSVNIAQAAAFSQNAVVRKTARGITSATGVFTVFCNAVTAGEINLVAFSTASVSATANATKPFDSALSSVSTVFAYTQDSLNSVGQAHISSEFSTNIVANHRVSAVIVTEAVASSLSVVVKAVAVQIPLDCNFTQTALVNRTRSGSSNQSALATISTTPFKTVTTQSTITAQSTVAASGTKVVSAVIVTEAVASTLTANIRIAGLFIECSVVSTVSASGVANKSAGATISSTATFTSATVKLVNASAAIVSSGSLSATVGVRKQFTAAFTSALTFVVAIRDLRLDEIVYVIPGENYVYKIISESRLSDIYGETRIRSVTGESRIRTITGESRIHIN
jgi:hypothetical protein